MIIYHSMILWIIILGGYYAMTREKNNLLFQENITKKVPIFFCILTFGYIIFWAGIRSGVADTAAYIQMFKGYSTELTDILMCWDSDHKAPGFDTFNILFKHFISTDYHIWLMAIALLSGIPIMLQVRKHSEHFFYSAFLFVVTLNFFWLFNGIRQFLAASILFALSDWIIERKTLHFMIVILLLSTVHYTALIMIPIYWIVTGKPFGKKIVLFIVVLLMSIVFLEPFVETLELTLAETTYSGFSEQFASDDGVNPIRVLVMLMPSAIAFVARKRLEYLNDKYINLCMNMSLVSAGLYFLGMFTSGILVGRLPIYFELYNLILLPYLVKRCFTNESTKIMFVLCTIGYIVFYYLQMGDSYYISDLTGLIGG